IPNWQEVGYFLKTATQAVMANQQLDSANLTGTVQISIIDVGQADSNVIRTQEKTIVIDAGEREDAQKILDILRQKGVKKIDYLIATHPHADHIGGMAEVIRTIPVDTIILSDIPPQSIPTTRVYTDLLLAIAEQGVSVMKAQTGKVLSLGGGATLTILAPSKPFSDLNNLSVVSKIVFGENSFLFTGDIEKESEEALLSKNKSILDVDVLSISHHGSNTSTTKSFLEATSPSIGTISVGVDNKYNHPHVDVIRRLEKAGVTLYRTDLQGTLTLTSDGTNITVTTEK
ncbi:MAG: ComEC/Rec2 family competence protein, partial [Oscillospiraceae bacterium]